MAECMKLSTEAPSAKPTASCPICTSNFDEVAETVALPCGHVFHSRCTGEWFKQSPTCPQCRKRLLNPQRDQKKIYLSFGDQDSSSGVCVGDGEEAPGLSELRAKLVAVTREQEIAKQQVRRSKQRDLMLRRDLNQKQRQLDEFTNQLRSCQESLAQQESENCQLMQLMAQEYEELSDQAKKLQEQLDEERLTRKRLEEKLHRLELQTAEQEKIKNSLLLAKLQESQQDNVRLMEALETEKSQIIELTDKILSLEAESFELSKRLHNCHAATSRLLSCEPVNRNCEANPDKSTKVKENQFESLPVFPFDIEITDSD